MKSVSQPAEDASSNPMDDARQGAVERVLASQQFVRSGRLSSFLRYVCTRALEGRQDEVTEQLLGLHVFDRPADFNAGEDNIVRSTARQLRQRLALYYQEDGKGDAIRIEVPRGGYVPVFIEQSIPAEPAASSQVTALPSPVPVNEPKLKDRSGRKTPALLLMLAFALGAVSILIVRPWLPLRTRSIAHPLWTALFNGERATMLVPGDAGLNMYNNLARTQVSVSDYIVGSYFLKPAAQTPAGYAWSPLAERRYTSIVDLDFAERLRGIPEFRPEGYSVRFARDIHVADFRNSNIILTGAPTYNPWVELFDRSLNFHIVYEGATNRIRVLNRAPLAGEKREYEWSADDPTHRGYAYIALVDNLHEDGKVLLIEGTTMAGVDAADAFLLNDPRMRDLLNQSTVKHKLKNFELLIEASVMDGSSPDAKVIAIRTY